MPVVTKSPQTASVFSCSPNAGWFLFHTYSGTCFLSVFSIDIAVAIHLHHTKHQFEQLHLTQHLIKIYIDEIARSGEEANLLFAQFL